ncbi:hypothetical protein IJF91_02595 [Candidatus Saccharibacteria bacterium]|nr:hypothetical protein [Candidatus Saccharibacteria bacterium]
MNNNEEKNEKKAIRPRGRMMDFSPRSKSSPTPRPVRENLSDEEQRRREIAKRQIARREEIHRQIEAQKEADIIANRRAIAAKRDLERRQRVEEKENAEVLAAREKEMELRRAEEERARKKALIEARALKERQRILAERRAKQARLELARRREAENKMRTVAIKRVVNPESSEDPLAKNLPVPEEPRKRSLFKRKETKVERRLGSVKDFEAELNDLENAAEDLERAEHKDVEAFIEDEKTDFLENIDKKAPKKKEEDTSKNNERYSLGGRSPFINTAVEKRPLSGGDKTFESTASAASRPKTRGRYVPYNEPIPHKNIYARSLEKEKKSGKDVPTMVVGETPKSSKVSLIVAIILTIILGAAVGAIAYLALFQ